VRQSLRTLLPATGALALGLLAASVIALSALDAPAHDIELLALILALTGSLSLIIGLGGITLAPRFGLGSLGARMIFAHLVVLGVAFFNVVVTAQLMFISSHDLVLLGLLLAFSAAISVCFAILISQTVVGAVRSLVGAARRMAAGDLAVRVAPTGGPELAELADAFNTMADRLAAAEAQRAEGEGARRGLVAAVSHDLRTPLASIRAMIEAINDGVVSDSATIQRYLRGIQAEVGHLSGLIDDLFEIARLDAGALDLHLSAGSIHDVLSDALESLRPQANAHGVELGGQVAAELPPVLLDESRILRVIYNLVDNAVRHTPAGGSVLLGVEELPSSVRIDVIDSGEGIANDDLTRIFDRFYRGEKSRSRGAGGAGLGLAIARGIVEAHGGQLWAENRAGVGARFSFTLPKAPRPTELPGLSS
jgi:signal transduction histidine kinase